MHEFYSSPAFEEKYTYTGADLGAVWSEDKTDFRLWAPTAKAAWVKLYHSGNPDADDLLEVLPLYAAEHGTWVAEKAGNLHGTYYTFLVDVEGRITEACDPYARTTGVNGRRAMVIDLAPPTRKAGKMTGIPIPPAFSLRP